MSKVKYKSLKIVSISALLFLSCGILGGCSVNPATGRQEFTPLLPASQEKQVGAEQHRTVVNEFGGIYNNPKLTRYVNQITKKVAAASELPADNFQVFILNSSEMNAFALPGGYVYVTRALVAVANTEAELAGVIGHEIGHVTARHAANRTNAQAISGIGAMLIGAVTGSQQLAQVAQLGSQGLVASYSRSQEDEADMLGVRYLAKAGYNPYAQSDFLHSLRIYTDYEKSKAPEQQGASMPSFFSTHPDTSGRVKKAREYASQSGIKGGTVGRDSHLDAIEGIAWGDDPAQGIVQGQTYIHPDLKIAFTVPDNYRIVNKPEAVYIQGSAGFIAKFDADFKASGRSPQEYIQYEFAKGAPVSTIQPLTVNGLDGVTALSRVNANGGSKNARLFAFQMTPTHYYRFLMAAPAQVFAQKEIDFDSVIQSFHTLSAKDAKQIKPYYVTHKKINSSDTLGSIAQNIPDFNDKVSLLRVLNGLDTQDGLPNTTHIKVISR
jgi:predicted Zn-dependent protease